MKIAAAGLCHSDLSVINGDRPRPTPMALGHEAAGIVEEVGAGVDDLKQRRPRRHGVRAELRPLPAVRGRPAGAVRAGRGRQHRRHAAVRRAAAQAQRRSRSTITSACSAFAEYATVSRRSLVKIDPELPLDEAALFGCAVLTGVGAVVNTAQGPRRRDRGGHRPRRRRARVAARRGRAPAPAAIVAIDLADDKLELAKTLGATDTFNARQTPTASTQVRAATARRRRLRVRARRLGEGDGARLQDHAPRRHDGDRRPAAAERDTSRCPQVNLVAEERTIKGSYIGTCVPVRDLPRYIALYPPGAAAGRPPADRHG